MDIFCEANFFNKIWYIHRTVVAELRYLTGWQEIAVSIRHIYGN